MTEEEVDLDALGLMAERRRSIVRLGSNDLGTGLLSGQLNSAMNQMSTGRLTLDFDQTLGLSDYFAGISVSIAQGETEIPRFTGSVVSAEPTGNGATLEIISLVSLSESMNPGMIVRGVPPPETIYLLGRMAGIADSRLKIDGLAGLPRETFEVVVPVEGITAASATHFGEVSILPASSALKSISGFSVEGSLQESFNANSYALTLVTASRMFEAEERGLAAIDLVLAWLTAQLRYGLTHLPDGSILQFDRKESLAQIFRKDAVSVRGLTTLRQWLRSPRSAKMARFVDLSTTSRRLDKSLPPLTLQDQLALLALSRATREPDPLAQVQALWEAVEFYVSGVEVSRMFSKAECRKIRKAVIDALPSATTEQHERLDHAIGQLNNAPLLIKLKASLDREGVPIADSELDLLWKLRQLRNDVVHGRNSTLPEPEDVEYAVSIIARMLLYRVLQG